MKKLIIVGVLIVSAMTFAAKITTKGKDWKTIIKENKMPEGEESIFSYNWAEAADEDNYVEPTNIFSIQSSDIPNDSNIYLVAYYSDEQPNNNLKNKENVNLKELNKINGFTDAGSDSEGNMFYTSYYRIKKSNVKGIYYVNNYIDNKGKKHSTFYFGFDEKSKKVVITDKNGNILKTLEYHAAG